jgi:alpha-1,6-mannosyltransferase
VRSPESRLPPTRQRVARRSAPLRVVAPPPLRVVDVALLHGQHGGEIRTYIDARAAWARTTETVEHHMIVPGGGGGGGPGCHELASLRLGAAGGARVPRGVAALQATLRALRPDVVLLHDPFWGPLAVARTARRVGASVVAVHHGSTALDAAALPGPDRLWRPALRAWMQHAVDGLVAAGDTHPDCDPAAAIALRWGLDPAFVPQRGMPREDHVLVVVRLGREQGVVELLRAAARSREPWRLRLVGSDAMEPRLRRLAATLGLGDRVQWLPIVADRAELARAYAAARVVVMPEAHETFGLVCLEAAACGACVVACSTAPSVAQMGELVRTYEPGDGGGLLRAIEAARAAEPDPAAAAALAARSTWSAAFEAQTAQLARLVERRRAACANAVLRREWREGTLPGAAPRPPRPALLR